MVGVAHSPVEEIDSPAADIAGFDEKLGSAVGMQATDKDRPLDCRGRWTGRNPWFLTSDGLAQLKVVVEDCCIRLG